MLADVCRLFGRDTLLMGQHIVHVYSVAFQAAILLVAILLLPVFVFILPLSFYLIFYYHSKH